MNIVSMMLILYSNMLICSDIVFVIMPRVHVQLLYWVYERVHCCRIDV